MDQDGSSLPFKPSFIISRSELDPNPYGNRNPSFFCDNNLYQFLPMSRISSNLREHNLIDPLGSSVPRLMRPSECHESNPEICLTNPKLHLLNDSLVVIKPLVSSKTSDLLKSQIIEKLASPSNLTIEKEAIFSGTNINTGNNHIEKTVPKKPLILSDGQNQFTNGYNAFSLPDVQTSRKISDRKDVTSESLPINNTTKTDNEIIALKAKIDSLYSKLKEIQQKHHNTVQNLQENEESELGNNNSNSIVNVNGDGSEYLKIDNETESVSCTKKAITQVYQHHTNSNQNEELLKQQNNENTMNSTEQKRLELSRQLCCTWENNDQLGKTELRVSKKPLNSSETSQEKTSGEKEEDEDIVLVDCLKETIEKQIKNNGRNPMSNHLGELNSASPVEPNKNCGVRGLRTSDRLSQQADKLKDHQYRNSASYKLGTKDTIIAVKRIQEFWNATYLSPYIKKAKNLDTSTQHEKVIQNIRPCFPRANYSTQSPTSIVGIQQPMSGFQLPIRFGSMLCFPNLSMSAENHSYFANPYNSFSQSEPVQFLTPSQPLRQSLPTMTAPIQAYQQHSNPLLNVQFSSVDNAVSATPNCPISYLLPQNSSTNENKLLLKNGLMSPLSRKKLLNSKLWNTRAQTVVPVNNITSVPNAVSFDHGTKAQNITRDMEKQNIKISNLKTLPRNEELQIPSTRNLLATPQSTTMNNYNCFL
ncbi:unnamed protein product [Wuchereria bancrofti]|uniref:Uncharacterized protein n=1 Tax=Wuchereria bancrofti TaxID=6293 RepID=A0A3P7D9P3_WUCBA|nr:unnamed protein product [Wuchereria bancrofti]